MLLDPRIVTLECPVRGCGAHLLGALPTILAARGARRSAAARIAELEAMDVTVSAEVLCFAKAGSDDGQYPR